MKKKIGEMRRALDNYICQMLKVRKVKVEEFDAKQLAQKKQEIENKYLNELMKEVEQENKVFYEQRAKDMMRRQEGNIYMKICCNLLL